MFKSTFDDGKLRTNIPIFSLEITFQYSRSHSTVYAFWNYISVFNQNRSDEYCLEVIIAAYKDTIPVN